MNTLKILSGADIGGSCYLLELYGARILFDCGSRAGSSYTEHPEIPDPETVDAIFISHAHIDHMGAIAYTAAVCKNARIFMSEQTRELVRFQLAATIAEYIGASTDALRFNNRILCQFIMNRIETVGYRDKNIFVTQGGVKCCFSLFHAGHVPGAAMIYLKVGDRKVLYTGDFAAFETPLTCPCSLPDAINPDIMIMCGTHANKPHFEMLSENALNTMENRIISAVSRNGRILIPVSQLTRGLEVIATVSSLMDYGDIPATTELFLEENLWRLAYSFTESSDSFILPSCARPLSEWENLTTAKNPRIVLESSGYNGDLYPNHTKVSSQFTLHADYRDLVELINRMKPSQLYVVHVAGTGDCLKNEPLTRRLTRIEYTENGGCYRLS